MKSLNFFLLFSLCFLIGKAQYTPFPEESAYWLINCTMDARTQNSYEVGHLYFPEGDTLINGEVYTKMYYSYLGNQIDYDAFENENARDSVKYSFCFRNDLTNKRVYRVLPDELNEELFYDFNLSIGDTINDSTSTYEYNNDIEFHLIVDTITEIEYCGVKHKAYHFKQCYPFENILVEGLGFTGDFLKYNDECSWFEPTTTCGSSLNYEACYEPYFEGILTSSGEIKNPFHQLSLYPNPSTGILQIEGVPNNSTVKVYTIQGRLILSQLIYKNQSSITLTQPGMYLIEVSHQNYTRTQKIFIK